MTTRINQIRTLAGLAIVTSLGFTAVAHAGDPWPEAFPTPLSPGALQPDSHFGSAVAVSGNLAAVGAPDDLGGKGSVYSYYFANNQWDAGHIVLAADGQPGDHFGASVAVDDIYIAVGAPDDDTKGVGAGAVYLYKRLNILGTVIFPLVNKFYASDAAPGAQFGKAVAAANGVIVVSAPYASPTKSSQGQVYAFENINSAWKEQKIVSPSPVVNEHFGAAVAVDANLLVVGCPSFLHLNPVYFNSGRAEVYSRSQAGTPWKHSIELTPPAPANFTNFGASVATSAGRVLVGAPGITEPGGKVSGGAYLYKPSFGIWFLDATMTTVLGAYGYETLCGSGVALTPSRAFVASPTDVSEFKFDPMSNDWVQASLLEPPFENFDPAIGTSLGPVVAADEPFLFVGRPSVASGDKGIAFPFYNDGGIFFPDGDGFGGAYGTPWLALAGPLKADLPFELRMKFALPQAQSILLVHAGDYTPLPFHTGTLITFPIHLSIVIPVDAAGEFKIPSTMPQGIADFKFSLQALVADPTSPAGLSMTNGIMMQTAP